MNSIEREIRDYIEDNPSRTTTFESMQPREKFDCWLKWNGINGHTTAILEALTFCGYKIST